MLNLIIFIPILGALAALLGAPARKTALAASAAQCLLSLVAFLGYDRAKGGFQYIYDYTVAADWKLHYLLAADGLSLVMLLLTGLVTFAAVAVTGEVKKREGLFFACVLLISAGAAGAFAAQDLFFFYAFHELALIPTFLLIGIWGSGERHGVAWKITLYLAFGSIVLLVGLTQLYLSLPESLRTFNMIALTQASQGAQPLIAASAQTAPALWLIIGFGVLVSLFPFHSWAPGAYASAPTPAAMLHAGVLKKFGLYGLIRIALPLVPEGLQHWASLLLVLLVGNIIYIGFVTIAQKKLDLMLGYSSVMHMGYIFLGIAALNTVAVSGAALLMFAHGLSIAALFALSGMLRERTETLAFDKLGGVGKTAPFLGAAFGLAAFASIGLPGFANFAGETMIFFGAYKPAVSAEHLGCYRLAVILGLWGVVMSAVYMLRAFRNIFWGEPVKATATLAPVCKCSRVPIILLLAALLIAGFFPGAFLEYIRPAVEALLK